MGGQPIQVSSGSLRRRRGLAAALFLLAAVGTPQASSAGPGQEEPSLEEQQQDIRERQGEVALEIDVMEADNQQLEAALATLESNVATQHAQLDAATTAAAAADTALADAETAVADAEARVAALNAASDQLVVQSFVSPPAVNAWDTLQADSLSDAAVMHAVLDMQADEDASVLDLLEQARDELSAERDTRASAASDAEAARATAAEALARVQTARDQQAAVVAEAEAVLNHRLTEAANLAAIDADLSRQIAEEAAEQARLQAEQAAAAAGPPAGTITPEAGGLSTVSCHGGGSITVADSLASDLQAMLDAAAADGVLLCGGGYRSPEAQIELRRQHCGTSYYAIYLMPASHCSPPTAKPGFSQHELGLAIDFANCSSSSTACYQWLSAHAADYGLYNLPGEYWHWSRNGK